MRCMDCKGDPCVCGGPVELSSGRFRASDLVRVEGPIDPEVMELSRAVKLAHELRELLVDVRQRRGAARERQIRDVVDDKLDGLL